MNSLSALALPEPRDSRHRRRRHHHGAHCPLPLIPADQAQICKPWRHPVRMVAAMVSLLMGGGFAACSWIVRAHLDTPLVLWVAVIAGLAVAMTGVALATVPVEWGVEEES